MDDDLLDSENPAELERRRRAELALLTEAVRGVLHREDDWKRLVGDIELLDALLRESAGSGDHDSLDALDVLTELLREKRRQLQAGATAAMRPPPGARTTGVSVEG